MEEEVTNAYHCADWLKWVSYVEKSKQAIFESIHHVEIPILLQVQQVKGGRLNNNSIKQWASSNNDAMSTRWREICQRIWVDLNLAK
jgi:hypothetical protein